MHEKAETYEFGSIKSSLTFAATLEVLAHYKSTINAPVIMADTKVNRWAVHHENVELVIKTLEMTAIRCVPPKIGLSLAAVA